MTDIEQKESVLAEEQLSATQVLASFVRNLCYDNLPEEAVNKAKQLIRDGLGNQLGASIIADPARVAIGLLREFGGAEQATITGYGAKLPVPQAALANAMLGHGIELDDAHANALTKSGSLLIPSVVTSGEHLGRNGAQTIAAAVVGYEIMVRIGLAINPSHRKRGFHTTGTVGAIASAGATAKQLALSAEQTNHALGLGAMQSAGIQAYLDDPCMAKPLSPGKAAFNGTLAAMLASREFTGPRYALESQEGFFNAYADELNTHHVFDGLDSDYKIMEIGFKPHAACRYAHGPIDAAQAIKVGHGAQAGEINKIRVRMCELAIRQSGHTEVPNLNSAMGSTPFGVALALTRGQNNLADYKEGFEDSRNHQLVRNVELVPEPEFGLMGRQAIVEVTLTDGRTVAERVEGPKGEPEHPMSAEELEQKFLGLAGLALGEQKARHLNEVLGDLENVEDLRAVTALLVR